MELALNLGWLILALCLVFFWLRWASPIAGNRHHQLVALALALIILLPIISVTDDLLSARNLAEVDTSISLRRVHDWLAPHAVFPAALALSFPFFALFSFHVLRIMARKQRPLAAQLNPAMAPIENRPPPCA